MASRIPEVKSPLDSAEPVGGSQSPTIPEEQYSVIMIEYMREEDDDEFSPDDAAIDKDGIIEEYSAGDEWKDPSESTQAVVPDDPVYTEPGVDSTTKRKDGDDTSEVVVVDDDPSSAGEPTQFSNPENASTTQQLRRIIIVNQTDLEEVADEVIVDTDVPAATQLNPMPLTDTRQTPPDQSQEANLGKHSTNVEVGKGWETWADNPIYEDPDGNNDSATGRNQRKPPLDQGTSPLTDEGLRQPGNPEEVPGNGRIRHSEDSRLPPLSERARDVTATNITERAHKIQDGVMLGLKVFGGLGFAALAIWGFYELEEYEGHKNDQ